MSKKSLLLLFTLSVAIVTSSFGEKPPTRSGWKLIWRDEFHGTSIDPNNWNILIRETSKHGELQYYLPDEVYIENDCLRIRSRVRNFGSQKFTSGRVDTRGKCARMNEFRQFEHRPGGKTLVDLFHNACADRGV